MNRSWTSLFCVVVLGSLMLFSAQVQPAVLGKNLVELLKDLKLNTYVKWLSRIGFDKILAINGGGSFTVFAPSDDAFNRIPQYVQYLRNITEAVDGIIVLAHIVNGKIKSSDIYNFLQAKTFLKHPAYDGLMKLVFNVSGNSISVNGSKIVSADNVATNGIIHVVEDVIIPHSILTYRPN